MNESVDKSQQYEQRPDCGIWCKNRTINTRYHYREII